MGTANRVYTKQELTLQGESNLLTYTRNRIELYGFDNFLFRMTTQYGDIQSDRKILTNHPTEFIDTFDASCLSHKNPIENHFKRSIDPLVWDHKLFSETPELQEVSHSYGLNYGWSLSAHDSKGTFSILSLSRRCSHISPQEFNEKVGNLLWLCHQLHMAMYENFFIDMRLNDPNNHLSVRESEVLKWTAQGKTASDIGMILNLTPRTVNFHISSAMRKMGATNKTSAVVIAAKLGLL